MSRVSVAPRSRPWDDRLDPSLAWLERANRHALGTRLVTATVHDVSNALQVVSGAAEMLGLEPGPEVVTRRSAAIVHQATTATTGLHQLAGFTREPLRPPERLRVRELAERALLLRQYSLRKLRVTALVEGDDGACTAAARPLLQVVLNLVLNAEQALVAQSAPTLTLTVATRPGVVTLIVRDNGPGLSEAECARAWLWPPPADPGPGTLGIGLLVSRALVAREGGTLALGPADGGGLAAVVELRG